MITVFKPRLIQASISPCLSGESGHVRAVCEFGGVGKLAAFLLSYSTTDGKNMKLDKDPCIYFSFLEDFFLIVKEC